MDERDFGRDPRVLFFLEHSIQDATRLSSGERRTVSRRVLYVEMRESGEVRHLHYAPYLDYRPLAEDEPAAPAILARPELRWVVRGLEQRAQSYAIASVVPEHVEEVQRNRLGWVDKARAAVKERLTREIAYWDHRTEELRLRENAGKSGMRLNSSEARRRAEELRGRIEARMKELDREAQLSALPPTLLGGLVVVPLGLIAAMTGRPVPAPPADTQASATLGSGAAKTSPAARRAEDCW